MPGGVGNVDPAVAIHVHGQVREVVIVVALFLDLAHEVLRPVRRLVPEPAAEDVQLAVAIDVENPRRLETRLGVDRVHLEPLAHFRRRRLDVLETNDRPPGHVVLRDLEHQVIGALLQCDGDTIGLRHERARDVVGMHDLAVEPSLDAVVTEDLQCRGSRLRRFELRAQIGDPLVATVELLQEIEVRRVPALGGYGHGAPHDLSVIQFRPECYIEQLRALFVLLQVGPGDLPIDQVAAHRANLVERLLRLFLDRRPHLSRHDALQGHLDGLGITDVNTLGDHHRRQRRFLADRGISQPRNG